MSPSRGRGLSAKNILLLVVVIIVAATLGSMVSRPADRDDTGIEPVSVEVEAVDEAQDVAAVPALDAVFFLGKYGQSGCLVCHADPNLERVVDGETRSFYVNPVDYANSPHSDVACTACHQDFGSTTHVKTSPDWREVASLACIRCHEHKDAYEEYADSIHGQMALAGQMGVGDRRPAGCGDCHTGHDVLRLSNPRERAEFRRNAEQVCGDSGCHQDYWDSYFDYYHGRGYKTGAWDAPTCWDCHGYHNTLPQDHPDSMVAAANLAETCESCHWSVGDTYAAFGEMIHGELEIRDNNVAWQLISQGFATVRGIPSAIREALPF